MGLDFLNSLDNNKEKKKYQSYTIELGLERIDIIVPFENCEKFEEKINKEPPRGSRGLSYILEEFDGKFEHVGSPTPHRKK